MIGSMEEELASEQVPIAEAKSTAAAKRRNEGVSVNVAS